MQSARYYSVVRMMADAMVPGAEREHWRARALALLVQAVEAEEASRGASRDVSVSAATRANRW